MHILWIRICSPVGYPWPQNLCALQKPDHWIVPIARPVSDTPPYSTLQELRSCAVHPNSLGRPQGSRQCGDCEGNLAYVQMAWRSWEHRWRHWRPWERLWRRSRYLRTEFQLYRYSCFSQQVYLLLHESPFSSTQKYLVVSLPSVRTTSGSLNSPSPSWFLESTWNSYRVSGLRLYTVNDEASSGRTRRVRHCRVLLPKRRYQMT